MIDSFSKSVQLGSGLERSGRLSRAFDWDWTIGAHALCIAEDPAPLQGETGCRLVGGPRALSPPCDEMRVREFIREVRSGDRSQPPKSSSREEESAFLR